MVHTNNYLESDFVSAPVDIETFLMDPNYLGTTYGKNLYPYWLDKLKKIFPTPLSSSCYEVMLAGSIGSGKTYAICGGILYDLYRLTLLKDPQKKWLILPSTPIQIGIIISPNVDNSIISDIYLDCINLSPYFKKQLLPGKGDILEQDMFPNHIGFTYLSKATPIIGRAFIGAILDDGIIDNVLYDHKTVLTIKNPLELYTSIKRRMITRFMGATGETPGRMWSITYPGSKLYSFIKKNVYGSSTMFIEPTIWDVQGFKGIYCGDKFLVYLGTKTEEPRIIKESENTYDSSLVISVPIEYYGDFEKNTIGALKDLAGILPQYDETWKINKV